MKLLISLGLATCCALSFAQTAPAPEQRAGTMKIVVGDVRVTGADSQERKLVPGDRVDANQTVVTGSGSSASMVLRDGTVMALGPVSRLDLRRFQYDSTTQQGSVAISLLRGTMRMITGLIGKNNHDAISVTARTTTVGIRGTDFIVSLDEGEF